jgi:hypothetical protein
MLRFAPLEFPSSEFVVNSAFGLRALVSRLFSDRALSTFFIKKKAGTTVTNLASKVTQVTAAL